MPRSKRVVDDYDQAAGLFGAEASWTVPGDNPIRDQKTMFSADTGSLSRLLLSFYRSMPVKA